jgi:hypothetical protein
VSGDFDTHFVKKYFTPEVLANESEEEMIVAALAAADWMQGRSKSTTAIAATSPVSNWQHARRNA